MPTGIEQSGPLPGEKFTLARWRQIFGNETGIISDSDGSAYGITLPSGSDTAEIGSATIESIALIHGHPHIIPAGQTQSIDIPASVGGGATGRTDRVVLRRDPATYGTAPGPIRLTRIAGTEGSSTVPDIDPATDLKLFRVTRIEGQSLNQASAVPEMTRLGRNLLVQATATLPDAPLGTHAVRAGAIFRRDLVGGSPDWVVESSPVQQLTGLSATAAPSDPNIGNTVSGWQRQSSCRLVRDGTRRWLHLVSRKGGSNIRSHPTSGHILDQHLATLHTQDRPPVEVSPAVTVRSTSGNTFYGGGVIYPSGNAYVTSWAPDVVLGPGGPDDAVVLDAVWWVAS